MSDTMTKVRYRWNHNKARRLVMRMLRWELKRGSTLDDVGHGCPIDDITNAAWVSWQTERLRRVAARREGKSVPLRHHPKAHIVWAFGKYFRDDRKHRAILERVRAVPSRHWYLHPAPKLEEELAERLNPAQRKLLKMLRAGYSKTECADMLGVSPSRVTQMIITIRVRCELEYETSDNSLSVICDKLLSRLLCACQPTLTDSDNRWVWWTKDIDGTWTDTKIAERRYLERTRVDQPTWYIGE